MANLTADQVVAIASIQHLIHDWAYDLDVNEGVNVAPLVTEDCSYTVRAAERKGRAAVEQFYRDRLAEFSAKPGGVPVQRHILSNLRANFRSATEASITFSLVYFTTAGMASGTKHGDPAAMADVRMNVRRDADGEWRISMFDSNQVFVRTPGSSPR